MDLYKLLNEALGLIEKSSKAGVVGSKTWVSQNQTLYISSQNISNFNKLLEHIYSNNEIIYTRFTRQKIYKFIEDELIKNKCINKTFNEKTNLIFFNEFEEQKSFSRYIIAPISGIRLDNTDKINLSIFEIGETQQLKSILSNDKDGYYIAVKIYDIYDDLIAIEEANNRFQDFIRLIVFFSGKNDKKILIKIGLPIFPSISHEQMYVETSSYHITENIEDKFASSKINNIHLEKIPVDNEFFYNNEDFVKLWEIYEKTSLNKSVSKMDSRILNASIAIGESALSNNIKNSIIYTSMALEILFSFDEGSLFQKSIGDKLSDTFAFIIGTDKDSRLNAIKSIKAFYRLRSALVHGGSKKTNNDYVVINMFLRTVINELLNNHKYKSIKNIEQLYAMVKEAQNSY